MNKKLVTIRCNYNNSHFRVQIYWTSWKSNWKTWKIEKEETNEIDAAHLEIVPEAAELLDEKFQLQQQRLKEEEEELKKEFNLNHLHDE